jgi:Tol biopolymer transport system component
VALMLLSAGTTLGPYEVVAPLGSGAMGEVYRARDTRLDRTVAIKILPADVAADPRRRERFRREARAISSLTHPHICTLYDIGEQDGVDFLVMECLAGETLAHRLMRGALPLEEVLQVATQLADALDAAHRTGLTHRDLKPANVMLTTTGAKVLDFGLAKWRGSDPDSGIFGAQVTAHSTLTQIGSVVGTIQYMAPEQVEGRPVDARADLFALGAIVYEMTTGRKAFEGTNASTVMAAILTSMPPPMSAVQPLTPPALNRVVRKCLSKDPNRRWQTAADLRDELAWIEEELRAHSTLETGVPQTAAPTTSAAPDARRAWVAFAAVLGLVAVALAIPAVRHLRETPASSLPETRTEIVTPATTDPFSFALSPDGRQIAFVASSDGASRLWLRSLAATTAQPLAGTEGAAFPFWSPDSRSIGFFADAKLKRLDLGGGAPQTLAAAPAGDGGTWNADNVILFAPAAISALVRVPASGGEAVAVTQLDRQRRHAFPFFLPDGRHFLFLAPGHTDASGIYLGSLDSPDAHRLTYGENAGAYLSTGWLLWVRAGTRSLVAQRLDLERMALTGVPVTLADPVAVHDLDATSLSVSAAGLVAYRTGGANRRQLAWFDRAGRALGPLGAPDDNDLNAPRVSPDGHRAAVHRTVQGNADIWLLDGTRTSRFTSDAARDRFPVWSPDGSRIAFDSNRRGPRDLYQKSSGGAGAEELLLESPQDKAVLDWSADGRFVLYTSIDPQTGYDLWVLPTDDERKPWAFLKTSFNERWGAFSPDGRWVAYMSDESGQMEIYVRPFGEDASGAARGASAQWQVSTSGGVYPRWRPDGQELYYLGPRSEMMAAPITVTGATLTPGAPVVLFPTRIWGGGVDNLQGRQYDVSRDGRFLINTVLDDAPGPITLLQNWKPDVKK